MVASQFNARLLDVIYKRLKARNGGIGEPEFRLRECFLMVLSVYARKIG